MAKSKPGQELIQRENVSIIMKMKQVQGIPAKGEYYGIKYKTDRAY